MSSPNFNGRVDIMSPNTSILFSMQDKIPTENKASAFKDAMTGNWYNTSLSDAFFSRENIQALQNGLRAGVMQKSNGQYVIGEQNTDQLKIIIEQMMKGDLLPYFKDSFYMFGQKNWSVKSIDSIIKSYENFSDELLISYQER